MIPMFRRLLVWLNGGEPGSHTEPPSRLDVADGVGVTPWREGLVEPSENPWTDGWRGL